MPKVKILFLYSELMGYNMAWFKGLNKNFDVEIVVIHWDKNTKSKYIPQSQPNVSFYTKSKFQVNDLLKFSQSFNPKIVYVSGWMDKDYLRICKFLKKNGSIIISGIDNQWIGSISQKLKAFVWKLFVKNYFNYLYTAGVYQVEFAKKLGFTNQEILNGLYCQDEDIFSVAFPNYNAKQLLYVGRLAEIKRVDWIYNCFNEIIKNEAFKDWKLLVIGNGPLENTFKSTDNINVIDFLQPEDLIIEINKSSIFCHASAHEPWGLVIHEMAAAGMPIVTTNTCGAASEFVIDGFNGSIFEVRSKESLKKSMQFLMSQPESSLAMMGNRSRELSKKITRDMWAFKFMSVLKNE